MKKLLALSAALFLTPLSTLAISLSDIQSNPDQYVLVSQDSESACYVDSYSIDSIRYEPPYYAMNGTVYLVLYSSNSILRYTVTETYDYNRCSKSLYVAERKAHPNASKQYIFDLMLKEMQMNNGLTSYTQSTDIWDLDGNFLVSLSSDDMYTLDNIYSVSPVSQCTLNSPSYHVANYMFFKGYNEYFGPRFSSKNLY